MNRTLHRRITTTTLAALAIASIGARADVAVVSTSDGHQMTYEYKGENLRINTGDNKDNYLLMVDGTLYSVARSDGEYMVIDVSQAMSMFGSTLRQATPGAADARVESFEATGRKQTVAGIEGEVYRVTYIDENGKRQQSEMVLSEDARALRFRDAVYAMARSITKSIGEEIDPKELQYQLLDKDMGVLSYGEDMTIDSIEATEVADARFVLPAEPMDMSGLGGMLGGGGNGDGNSGGFMSGIMGAIGGGSAESGQKEAEEKASEEDKEATPMDDIGKAFGKLFGN